LTSADIRPATSDLPLYLVTVTVVVARVGVPEE
jgi:hypothetical protein